MTKEHKIKKFRRINQGYTPTPKVFGVSLRSKRGYTLIETMISVSLFLIVIMSGMGSLLNSNLLHQKSQDMRSIMDNLSFVLDDMSRNLRTGYDYRCYRNGIDSFPITPGSLGAPRSCASGWGIAFESADGNTSTSNDQWAYSVDFSGQILRSTDGASSFIELTPPEVVVNNFSLSVLGAEAYPGNLQQPFVIIKFSGTITSKGVVSPFSLQTSVSQRRVDI